MYVLPTNTFLFGNQTFEPCKFDFTDPWAVNANKMIACFIVTIILCILAVCYLKIHESFKGLMTRVWDTINRPFTSTSRRRRNRRYEYTRNKSDIIQKHSDEKVLSRMLPEQRNTEIQETAV
jgi:hypothetical protein